MEIVEELCERRPSDGDIDRFESMVGDSLPEDYTAFLQLHNGGRPNPSGFTFVTRNGTQEDGSVHYFYGLHEGHIGSLQRQLRLRGERVPLAFLPIGTDPFGNLILLGTKDSFRNGVYFWDHELEEDHPSIKNIFRIADSFSKFLDGLSQIEPTA